VHPQIRAKAAHTHHHNCKNRHPKSCIKGDPTTYIAHTRHVHDMHPSDTTSSVRMAQNS
jgi:hypothetical protein